MFVSDESQKSVSESFSSAELLGMAPSVSGAVAMYSRNIVQKEKWSYNLNYNLNTTCDNCKLKVH